MHFLLPIFSYCLLFLPIHAFYVSVTDIEFFPEEKLLEVQVKIFTDDLEDDIRSFSSKSIQLEDGINSSESQRVQEYLLEKIELRVDGQIPLLEKFSCRIEGDAVFAFFRGGLSHNPKQLQIRNQVLVDLFPTQSNIIRLKNTEMKGMLKLNKKVSNGVLRF